MSPESIELMEFFNIKSSSGKNYLSNIDHLMNIMLKILFILQNYPFSTELIISDIKNGNIAFDDTDLGVFSEKEYCELLRTFMINENEHVGRYLISWHLLSLSSLSDQYIDNIASENKIKFNTKQKNWNIKRKIRFILESLDLWEEFKEEKDDLLDSIETIFNQLYEKRHMVAHKELTPQWAKELIDRNFKAAVSKNLKFQKITMDIFKITTEENKEIVYSLLEFNSTLEVISRVFISYFGFLDNFIVRNNLLDE